MFDLKIFMLGIISFIRYIALITRALIRGTGKRKEIPRHVDWWRKPGLSIMYQIEKRPGWNWDRDYIEFNKSMTDEEGNLNFNGPFCIMDEWVRLSLEVGVDYHSFEVKWHDGICYFNTDQTAWKTETDYTKEFSDLSRKAGIPFMFYYSSVFDHNPQFDCIQPKPRQTPSTIGSRSEYREYLKKQYDELMGQYRPDGLWLDWYWADASTKESIRYLRQRYPHVVIAFNLSNLFPCSFKQIDLTSGEAHRYDGPLVRIRKEDSVQVPVLTSAVKWSNLYRMVFEHQWEVVSPAGKWWQDQSLRDDPLELVRTLAVVLACGGKLHIGATSQMDGHIFPDQVKQLKIVGEWYKPRNELFVNAVPVRYRWFFGWFPAAGVRVNAKGFDSVVSAYGDGLLLHIINPTAFSGGITVTCKGRLWSGFNEATLKPQEKKIAIRREGSSMCIDIAPEMLDPVDTIICLTR